MDKNIKKNYQIKFEVFNALINAPPKRNKFKIYFMEQIAKLILDFLVTDCTHGGRNAKYHHNHVHSHANDNNLNNNTTNVNNNKTCKRQYSISEDGTTISEDDLDNLINQSINEWKLSQKSTSEIDKIDIDLNQSAPIIS